METAIHVTFDRNVAIEIWKENQHGNSARNPVYNGLLSAINAEKIKPYISEATLTFELFSREDRLLILARYFARGSQRPNMPEVSNLQKAWINQLLSLGFKVLRQPPRGGLAAFVPLPRSAWAEDIHFSREERIRRQHELVEEFENMTFSRLKNFGLDLARLHGLFDIPSPKQPFSPYPGLTWYNGLEAENRSPKGFQSREEFLGAVRKIFSDWFDVDAVASHYGYGFDYFCTTDKGRGSRDETIFHPDNQKVLASKYGVCIVNPKELLRTLD